MMPNTGFALLCLGLASAIGSRAPRAFRVPSRLAALLVLGIGSATFVQYVWSVDLHVDQLLLPVDVGPYPGRPSPAVALALSTLAAAVLLMDVRLARWGRPAEWLSIAGGIIALTALVALILGAGELYSLTGGVVIGVALPTALGLLSLTAGLLFQLTDSGIMSLAASGGPGGITLRRLGAAIVVAPIVLAVVVVQLLKMLGVQELSLVLGTLVAAITLVGVLLLASTARSLERSHAALEANRAATRTLVEQASDGIFIADASGRYIEVNGAGCRMLGYRREEILGKSITDLLHPQELERFAKHRDQIFAGATEVSEWTLCRADGSVAEVEVSAKLLPDGRWQGLVRDIRERKRAQEELRESQERFELTLRGADLAAWDWNIVTGAVVYNERWGEMRGYRPEDVRPHVETWSSGVHPEDWPRVEAALNDHFEGRSAEYESEHRVRARSGEWLWILDRGKVFVRDEAGRPIRMLGTELDITQRKRLEEELRRSEVRASGILSISADAIISIDEEQRIVLYNEGAEKIFGYSKAEAIGAPVEMLIPERLRAVHHMHFARFAQGDSVARRMVAQSAEILGRRKSGEEFAIDATISKLQVDDRRIFTVALRDVAEQRRSERAQKLLADVGATLASSLEYEETLSAVARLVVRHQAHLCIVDIVEEDGEVRRLSVAWSPPRDAWLGNVLKGVPAGKIAPQLLRSVCESCGPVTVHGIPAASLLAAELGEQQARSLEALGLASAVGVPFLAHGKLLGALAIVSFGAPRPYDSADLSLAQAVAERAALAIENARLYRAACEAIQARDDVLAIVAHDLRNPLGVVLVQSSLLLQDRGQDPLRRERYVKGIERAATRMNRLIQDLLDVASLDAGHLSIEREKISPAAVVHEAVATQRALADSVGLGLRADLPPELPPVWADRDRLVQVFENLIGNALKFTHPGGSVRVGAEAREREVVFHVADTGAGIAPEDLPHLFERFWQDTKTYREGAGLGLAIVRGIVEMHGGRTWAESEQGRGTTIFFSVPTTPLGERASNVELRPAGPERKVSLPARV